MRPRTLFLGLILGLLGGCRSRDASRASPLPAALTLASARPVSVTAAELAPPERAPKTLAIPAGAFACGSTPGDPGRDPAAEPARREVTLGAYEIDALPFPNDPGRAPELAGSPEEAVRRCAEDGARLCTELEWERACAGPKELAYATGAAWEPACDRAPSSPACASGFGVRALGFLPEWVDGPVLRGNGGHRCAARARAPGHGEHAAFRCCRGEPNAAAEPPVTLAPAFRRTKLDGDDLARIFATIPELARIREGVRLFGEAELRSAIVEPAGEAAEGITFSSAPIVWSPSLGVELLVATGRAKKTGFIVALWTWRVSEGAEPSYRYASSFLLLNDASVVALAWEPSRRKSLLWTSCFHCAGEQGSIAVHEDGRVAVVQH